MLRNLLALLAFSLFLVAGVQPSLQRAEAFPVDSGHAQVDVVSEQSVVVPGQTFRMALHLDLDYGWHVYWKNAGDSGLPPELYWDDGIDVEATEFSFPAPHEQPLDILPGQVGSGGVQFLDRHTIQSVLSVQACYLVLLQ
mgnify:CR=1 FL=1